jgi:transcriptional regulator with XRE-family HTH domain
VPGDGVSGFRRDRLRAARRAAGFTQLRLAEQLGLSRSQISDWERGAVAPRGKTLLSAAHLLGVEVAELVDTSPTPTLRQLRQLAGLSQRDVAAAIGVSQPAYAALERGAVTLRPQTAETLARTLGTDVPRVRDAWERSR